MAYPRIAPRRVAVPRRYKLNGRKEERKQNATSLRLAAMLPSLDHLGRHSGDQASTFDVFGHDGSRSDRDSISDGHAGADRSTASDPTVLSDGDRQAVLFAGLIVPRSFVGVCSMRGGVYLDVGRQQRVTTDGDCYAAQTISADSPSDSTFSHP